MFFWKKKPSEDELKWQARQDASLQALQAGGLPLSAQERLQNQLQSANHIFSSDLTTREYLLTREAGYRPISQVMGCSFMNISIVGQTRRNSTGELKDVSQAQSKARHLAIERLRQEAAMLNATGVIGIRLTRKRHGWDSRMVEFTAVGTAIHIPGHEAEAANGPFTSLLSGQEFWQLHSAGYWPVGVCMGVSSYYIWTDPNTQKMLYSFWGNNRNNSEIPAYTQGFYAAREHALAQLSTDVEKSGGDGAIGMLIDQEFDHIEFEYNNRTYRDYIANFTMLGTGVRKLASGAAPAKRSTLVMYDLAQKKNVDLDVSELKFSYAGEREFD
jgi:uncharacterized protein YbjQ (UPF0145 family)